MAARPSLEEDRMPFLRRRGVFDLPALAARVEAVRRERNISFRQVGREAGIDGTNMTGRLAGSSLDAETFVRLLLWLGETDVGPYVRRDGQ